MKCKYCGVEIGNSLGCQKLGKQRVQYVQNLFILIKNIVLIVEVLQFIVSLSQ